MINYNPIFKEIRYNIPASVFLVFILGIIDWHTGYELSFQFFYFIPLTLLAFNENVKKPVLIAIPIFTAFIWMFADLYAGHHYTNIFFIFWNTLSRLIVFMVFTVFLNTIVIRRSEVNQLNKVLNKKNELIVDSLNYSKIIQDAIIPNFNNFKIIFPESFILNIPKDILSGDFFWHHKTEGKIVFGIVDCTGHGVPGALMSIAGNVILHKIVFEKNISSPAEILTHLDQEILHLFSSGNGEVNDGMEISIISFDLENRELIVSQTMQGILIIDSNGKINKTGISNSTIGGLLKRSSPDFFNVCYKIENGSILYLFSDGYFDQFGGEKHERFNYQRFEKLLDKIHLLSINEQNQILRKTIVDWENNNVQTDDITVIGIKF